MSKRRVIDLFAGAGGFSLGAHLAGFAPALAVEIDRDLASSRPLNFPGTKTLYADLGTLAPAQALKEANITPNQVTGIIGGPPCQGYSEMGRQDPRDERNALVGRFFDYVAYIQPSFFILENVPGILEDGLRIHLDEGLSRVGAAYQIVGPMILDAKEFGAATCRQRAVVVGYQTDRVDPLSEADIRAQRAAPATIHDAIRDVPPPLAAERDASGNFWGRYDTQHHPLSRYARHARRAPPTGLATQEIRTSYRSGRVSGLQPTAHTPAVLERFLALQPGEVDRISKYPRLRWDGFCTTLRAGTGRDHGSFQAARPIHPEEPRVITVREAARIQGFPDWFQFHPTIWHSFRMIGNSVSPYMAEVLLRLLRNRLGE
jgi:DNA (cytosine-5)-methyltransferase 1